MKNKKLIATVASLCLVLVAVVAAVVGVLAAAQQAVTNKIKVGYIAKANVYATVSLNGKTEFTDWGTAVSQTFNTNENQTSKELVFAYDEPLAMSESSEKVPGKYALYQFKFENLNPTHALEVSMKYTEKTGDEAANFDDTAKNVRLFWVASSDANYSVTTGDNSSASPTLLYNAAGVLQTQPSTVSGAITLNSGEASVYDHDNTTPNAIAAFGNGQTAAGSVQYIYLIVAVINLNNDATFDMNATNKTLVFTLDGYRAPAQSNQG